MSAVFRETVEDIVGLISYKPGWSILVRQDDDRSVYLQVSVTDEADASLDSAKRDGTRAPWRGGKRYLSKHMCRQEIVGVIFDMFKAAEMHEIHEWFRYRNASIYNPHLSPDVLADVARKASSFVVRANAMTMEETP